jgi:MoxR-like ATPase
MSNPIEDSATPVKPFPHYLGDAGGGEPTAKWKNLPVADIDQLKDPAHYLAPPGLAAAVNVALELGMPLLLTGDPGCGKSRLADSLAWELGFPGARALRFVVTSETVKRDLFYEFDAVGRFRAARDSGETRHQARHFIKYNALGLAILRANGGGNARYKDLMREQDWQQLPQPGERSVVLIDEIDKAPREVPNDLLTQIEDLSFSVPELLYDGEIRLEDERMRPVIVITSNSERDLPPAFLRRCIYYHVELPPFQSADKAGKADAAAVTIERIVAERLGSRFSGRDRLLAEALDLFRHFRNSGLEQKPSLGELLAWLLYLGKRLPPADALRSHPELQASLGILVKPHHEQERQRRDELFQEWLKPEG